MAGIVTNAMSSETTIASADDISSYMDINKMLWGIFDIRKLSPAIYHSE
ncbi:Uncharacterised protein [Yersinia bercovieri]|nr:Uncharacterised protein [Yersinia bercovieri]